MNAEVSKSQPFDPYHKWFGIPAHEQPPNQYRLLRIAQFESDAEVIENAYDKEMGNLKQQEHGPHAELVEPLSRELIAARICLLDAKKRAVYDAELREKQKTEEEGEKLAAEHAQRKTIDERNRPPELPSQTSVNPREAALEISPPGSKLEQPGNEVVGTTAPLNVLGREAEDELRKVAVTPNLPERSGRGSGRPRVPTSRLTPLHAVDRLLAKLAGDGNTWLHGFLRVAAVMIPIAVLVAVIWLVMRVEDDDTPPGSDEESFTVADTDPNVGARAGEERDDNVLKMKFCWCPPGKFTMGSPTDELGRGRYEDQVAVTLTRGLWLGKQEVTQDQWVQVMGTKPWSGRTLVKEGADYPATYVVWDDAMEFCTKLTEQERRADRLPADWQYTLPTEAQWEYACRASTSTRFSFGDDKSQLGEFAWFAENAGYVQERYAHQVGVKKSNEWGLHDMHGNVLEWCRDCYQDKLPGGTNPEVASHGSNRVFRGGSWDFSTGLCRSADRSRGGPDYRNGSLGFRVAAVPSSK